MCRWRLVPCPGLCLFAKANNKTCSSSKNCVSEVALVVATMKVVVFRVVRVVVVMVKFEIAMVIIMDIVLLDDDGEQNDIRCNYSG